MDTQLTQDVKAELKKKVALEGNLLEEKIDAMCSAFDKLKQEVLRLKEIADASQVLAEKREGEMNAFSTFIGELQNLIRTNQTDSSKYIKLKDKLLAIRL